MLYVSYSHRAEDLLDALAADFAERSCSGDPLRPQIIATPNREVADEVRRQLVERNSVAANIETPTLEAHLTAVVQAADSATGVLAGDQMQLAIATALADDKLLQTSELAPVSRYVRSSDPEDAALRRVQLAAEISQTFTRYALERPRLLQSWVGPSASEVTGEERWQRALFRALVGKSGVGAAGPDGKNLLPLPLALEKTPSAALANDTPLFVYGYATLPPGILTALQKLSSAREVRLYALNPCREYWEDLHAEAGDTPALRLWGRPGRDFIRFLGEMTGHAFRDCSRDPATADTLLLQLQNDIASRAPERSEPTLAADSSLQLLACPSPRREVEAIAAAVVEALRSDRTLRLEQIAVRIASREFERYRPLVAAVFAEFGKLPHRIAGVPLQATSPSAEALALLLDLPLGSFSRPEMMRVLLHPSVVARYPDTRPEDWLRWAERLGIVHGADREDHAGTYIDGDLFNWDQGIRRLAVGAFMSGERSGDKRIVRIAHHDLVPEALSEDQMRSAARLALLCRSLIADCRYARRQTLPLSQWTQFFAAMIDAYLQPLDSSDEQGLGRCRRALSELAALDSARPMPYREAREFLRGSLARLQTSSSVGSGGVSVAPLERLGARPYRLVFLAGMSEGAFPEPSTRSTFDVRDAAQAGEVSPLDRDRYLFLEALMTARDRLVISYPARHETTGDERAPSAVVQQLLTEIARGYTESSIVRQYRLNRYEESPTNLRFDPVGTRWAHALELRRDLDRAGIPRTERHTLIGSLRANHPDIAESIAIPHLPEAPRNLPSVLPLSRVRKFYEAPLSTWAETVLGLREGEIEDLMHRDSEYFARERLHEVTLLRETFLTATRTGAPLEKVYEQRARLQELSGAAPTGLFSRVETVRHLQTLCAWRSHSDSLGEIAVHAFGRTRELGAVDLLTEPLEIEFDGHRTTLVGTSQPVAASGPLILIDRDKATDRHTLRGLVETLILRTAGILPESSEILLLSLSGLDRLPVAPTTQARAEEILRQSIQDLLENDHNYFLPCEVFFQHRKKPGEDIRRLAAKVLADDRHSEKYGPICDFSAIDPQAPLAEIVQRRLTPLYDLLVSS